MKHSTARWLVSITAALAPLPAVAERFALVVGENEPAADSGLAPLRYADDDALRHAELLRAAGAQVETLVVLDDTTQRRFPGAAAGTRPATLANLRDAMVRLNGKMDAARAGGRIVDFHFVFAGHGEVGPNGEGRMHLRDGALSREALLREVVAASRADYNHLLIDACNAQSLVFSRGAAPKDDGYRTEDYRESISRYLDAQDLRSYPNTGAMLASTSGRESHEWEVFESGIFSHQVRSGLAGAADVNGDGAVEYSELAAWIQAANDGIADDTLRPQIVFQAPMADRNRPVLNYADEGRTYLRMPRTFTGRAWLEDDPGSRYADFNASGEAPVMLALGGAPTYWLRQGDREARIEVSRPGVIEAGGLTWRNRSNQSRGARGDAFERHLFGRSFGLAFYAGFISNAGHVPVVAHAGGRFPAVVDAGSASQSAGGLGWAEVAPWAAAGVAVVGGGLAAWSAVEASDAESRWTKAYEGQGIDDRDVRGEYDTARRNTWIFGGLGVVAAGTAAALWLTRDDAPDAPAVGLPPSAGGLDVFGRF